jgi:subtilisin family serine protease
MMHRTRQTPPGSRGSAAIRILTVLALLSGALLAAVQLPRSVLAGAGRDPIWNARLNAVPPWLEMPKKPSQLYTEYQLPKLAGKLITFGEVDPRGCLDGGLNADKEADRCGLQTAQAASNIWQNRFNAAILKTSQESGVPPRLLKNIFAWESQFWPERLYVNTFEYGLGHMTVMGADTTMRWDAPFYDAVCASSFSSDTCSKAYADLPDDIRLALMGVVVQRADADCSDCKYYLDLPKTERSIPLFAETLLANATFVKRVIRLTTRSEAADVASYEDLWKFTLTSYNAGPGCFANAFSTLVNNRNPLTWKNLSMQLEPGCRGAIPYVEFISSTNTYYPEHDPSLQPAVPADGEPTSTLETPVITGTLESTSTPPVVTPAPTGSEEDRQTPTPTQTPASTAGEPTATSSAEDSTVTPPATDATPTPSPTTADGDGGTPPPEHVITPTPGGPDSSPTPTAADVTLIPTGVFSSTLTVTPSTPVGTPQETSLPLPTGTPEVEPVEIIDSHATNEIVLKIDPRRTSAAMQTLRDLGINPTQDISEIETLDTLVIQVPPEQLTTLLAILQSSANFLYAEPNYLVMLDSIPNDPEFSSQGNLQAIQAPQTWDALPSMQEVLVAVVDTGVDVTHPDLADRIWQNAGETGLDINGLDRRDNGVDDDNNGYADDWQGWNMVSGDNNVGDTQGHGTHLAGIIGAGVDNLVGIAGVAPNARILPVKALDDIGFGTYAQVAEAITYATDMGARVINLGFSGTGSSELLQAAVDYAIAHNVLVVAAAGNSGSAVPNYPAGYSGVVAVSAVDNNGYWAPFSASGDYISLSAPGIGVLSTGLGGSYRASNGTSQAAAHVSGVAALLAGQAQFSDRDYLRTALLLSARDLGDAGTDPYFGYGMLQAFSALQYAGPVLPTPTPWLVPTATPGGPGGLKFG